jgi:SAM-dependent methyltransferase
MRLENTSCYNCGSAAYKHYDSENGFNLVKCSGCGLLYVTPRPSEEDISKAKLTGVHEGDKTITTTGRYARRRVGRYVNILKDLYPDNELKNVPLHWFDIGCGFGEFLEALARFSDNKIEARGAEQNEIKIRSAKKRNLDAYDFDASDKVYDYVSLLNVYSHLPNPVKFIGNLKKIIKPGGELLIETGDTCQLDSKYHHKPYYLPDHLSFANREIVENILMKCGFEIIRTRLYRSPLFPRLYSVQEVAIEFLKIVLRKHGSFKHFFPKHPNRDMYIRCRLIN